jgi:hypothetical protein
MKNFFTKNKTVVIALTVITILLLLGYFFKDDIKSLFAKKEDPESDTTSKKEKPSGSYTPPAPTQKPAQVENTGTYGNTEIGKKVYAIADGVKILFKSDASTYRTKNKGEFVGVITGNTTLAGSPFYSLGNGLVVAKNNVQIK